MNKAEKAAEKIFEAAFNEWESNIPEPIHEALSDLAMSHTYPVRGILREAFRKSYESLIASQPTPEAVAVAFGEWIRKRDHIPGSFNWLHRNVPSASYPTKDLFTLFTQSEEYKKLGV